MFDVRTVICIPVYVRFLFSPFVRSLSENWIIFSSSVLDQKYATLMLVLPSYHHSILASSPYTSPYYDLGGFPDVMTYLVNLLILLSTSLYSEGEWYTVINGDNMLVGSNTPSSQKKESITCKTKKREKMKLWSIYGRSPRQQEHRKWMIPLWELGRSSLLDVGNGWVAFSQWRSLEQAKHIL